MKFGKFVLVAAIGLFALGGVVPIAAGAAGAPAVTTAPAAAGGYSASGPYSASGDSSLLRLDVPALSPAVLPQTNVDLAHSKALADSDADLDAAQGGNQRTFASAATTGSTSLLGQPLDLQTNTASAPEREANNNVLIPLDVSPLLNIPVISTSAAANFVSDTECITSTEPLSKADQTLADVTVINPAAGQSVVAVDLDEADGAADTEAITSLPATGGPNDARAVQSKVATRVAGANVLNGFVPDMASLIQADVVRAPQYTVTASGLPGGASVTGDDPVVRVNIAGQPVIEITAGQTQTVAPIGVTLGQIFSGLDPLLQPLAPLVRISVPVTKTAAADGTSASVDASILRVEVLAPDATGATAPITDALKMLLGAATLDVTNPLLTLDLAPIKASVVAPAGGITCAGDTRNPLELQKVNSGPAIPGGEFDYTIPVGNIGDCTFTNLKVTDVLEGPDGTKIVSTDPPATTIDPTGASNRFTLTWSLPDLAPDTRTVLRIRVSVPTTATPGQRYTDTVTAEATCDDRPLTRTVTIQEPVVEGAPDGPCNVEGSNKAATHTEVYEGEQFAYLINVYNSGAKPCADTTVTDTLIEGVTFVSCSDGCTVEGRKLTWKLGSLAAGTSRTLNVVVSVNSGTMNQRLPDTASIDTASTNPFAVSTDGPLVTGQSVLAGNNPARTPPNRAAQLPRTGPGSGLPFYLVAGLSALALGARRIRRHATN